MNYYIEDYEYEKHDLLVEEGDKTQLTGAWLDMPELVFCDDNEVKAGYALSITNGEQHIITFYNDLYLKAKDGHKLTPEEIMIFMVLLISETTIAASSYLSKNFQQGEFPDPPAVSPADILYFVVGQLNRRNSPMIMPRLSSRAVASGRLNFAPLTFMPCMSIW